MAKGFPFLTVESLAVVTGKSGGLVEVTAPYSAVGETVSFKTADGFVFDGEVTATDWVAGTATVSLN